MEIHSPRCGVLAHLPPPYPFSSGPPHPATGSINTGATACILPRLLTQRTQCTTVQCTCMHTDSLDILHRCITAHHTAL